MRSSYQVTIGERAFAVSGIEIQGDIVSFSVLGERHTVALEEIAPLVRREASGRAPAAAAPRRAAPAAQSHSSVPGAVCAPISGVVVSIDVAVGATVTAGQVLMVLEAMKMENPLRADRAGTVKEILAKKGGQVKTGEAVAVIE